MPAVASGKGSFRSEGNNRTRQRPWCRKDRRVYCTVIVAVPVADPDFAVMVAVPTSSPVTVPFDETPATSGLLVDHDTGVVMMAPDGSRTVAVSVTVPRTPIVAEDGETCRVRTPGETTSTVAVPTCPSLIAVIVAVPVDTPVTTPLLETVAIEVWLLDQDTTRPLSVLPDASERFAVRVVVCPIGTLDVAGDTVTLATGTGTTVTFAQPSTPSMLAKMTALPVVSPVTPPVLVTAATFGTLLDQVVTLPVNAWPFAPRAWAVNMIVAPTVMVGWAGVTRTVATGVAVTVTSAVPLLPPLVPVMVALPGPTPVTRPLAETVAIEVFDEE